jgi:pimeloyl-ACP methyl ester carboxylesterase
VPRIRAGDVLLEVERLGDPAAPALVLVNGLGSQLVRFDSRLCAALVAHGLQVVRFDNRDAGLSTKLDHFDLGRVRKAVGRVLRGEQSEVAYRLEDMADDVAALLDSLGIGAAHLAGNSLGGMIVQLVAIRHPARVASLTSIMSTTGDRSLPPPTPEAARILMTEKPRERAAWIEHDVVISRALHGDALAFDEGYTRRRAELEWERYHEPDGVARQFLAASVQASRREPLRRLRVPTLVIHGDRDPLIPLACGLDTHACVPGAKLRVVRGMGHDLQPSLFEEIAEAIGAHAAGV